MRLEEIRGQDRAVRVLQNALRSGRIGSAYLFSGPRGVGKRSAARAFAAALLCETAGTSACGACRSCGKTSRDVHPDLVEIRVAADRKEITVGQIRDEVLAHVPYPPYEAARRVVLFTVADDLSVSAANSLLRSVEEPGRHTHFVFVSAEAHRLLPTVRSRCQEVRFMRLSDALVAEILVERGVRIDDARRAAAFSEGSVGHALTRLEGDLADRVATAEALDEAAHRGLPALVEAAAAATRDKKKREALPEVLEAWLLLRRDLLRAGEGAPDEALLVAEDPAALRRRALATSPRARVRGVEAVHEAIRALERYANPELVLDRTLLEIGGAA